MVRDSILQPVYEDNSKVIALFSKSFWVIIAVYVDKLMQLEKKTKRSYILACEIKNPLKLVSFNIWTLYRLQN